MKLTLERSTLVAALAHLTRVVEKRSTIPILANVALRAADSTLGLTTTNLDMTAEATVTAEIATAGEITVPAAMLYDIARKLPEGAQIALETDIKGIFILTSVRSRFVLPALPIIDFPEPKVADDGASFTLTGEAATLLFGKPQFAISNEEARYYLNGIYLHAVERDGAGFLRTVATDGHRLVRIETGLPEGASGMAAIIVPRPTVNEILKLADKAEGIGLQVSATQIRIRSLGAPAITLTSKVIDGTFPDYERVIPRDQPTTATINRPAAAAAVDLVSAVSTERGRSCRCEFTEGQLVLQVATVEGSDGRKEIDATLEGPPVTIGFNARYLADAIAAFDAPDLKVSLIDGNAPAMLTAAALPGMVVVQMPMRA